MGANTKILYNKSRSIRVEIEKISDRPYYSMQYQGDYLFDEYLKQGAGNLLEYCDFIDKHLITDQPRNSDPRALGCGAFIARNPEGDILFARNMDCECAIPMRILIKEKDNIHSIAFLSMAELDWDENTFHTLEEDTKLTLAAPYSPLDGMNEYGLAVASLTDAGAVYPTQNKTTLLDLTLPRLILNKAKTVEEALQLAGQYNLFYIVAPSHYLIADSTGSSAVIEFVNGRMVTIEKEKEFQVVTNFRLYDNPDHIGFGKDRYDNLDQELEKRNGIITEKEALDLLKKNVIPGDEQWSAVYNLTRRKVLITFSREYDCIYQYEL